jgi:hypothetical protein
MDTPHPFLKIGSQLLRGDLTPLIGDEVILGLIRSESHCIESDWIYIPTPTPRLSLAYPC